MAGLSFITPIAYDYRYAFQAIRSYYEIADEILLAVDADRLTWMRQPFQIDMSEIGRFVSELDVGRKIRIVEGNYHRETNPLTNETQERCALSTLALPGNWIVQIDADEVLLNAVQFREWLLTENPVQCNVHAAWITVFKVFGDQVLIVDPIRESAPVATMLRGQYWRGRNVIAQQPMASPLQLLHLSWGRSREEVQQKLSNWGHSCDFDTNRFFQFWEWVDLQNYTFAKDFHPIKPPTWEALKLLKLARDLADATSPATGT
jgi:hypothetical protein